ncbi:HNH endonuclease, partial [Ralstonia solanacearum]|nr:HNH endonuclease [Ralstonia solanacearum]MBB6594012.1 HNH endonuclease [Ralstonia solanacearum]MDB0554125.1 HNH endonuclease [Ralstonia solanacearum]
MKCVYCAEIISVGSLEHVLPQCLGGDFAPKELQTQQCCKRCNSLLGRYVDRTFR